MAQEAESAHSEELTGKFCIQRGATSDLGSVITDKLRRRSDQRING